MTSAGLKFQDKVAIVTGACSGIGKGCLDVLVENGGIVAAFDINDQIGNQIQAENSGKVLYVHCDVTNEQEVKECIERTVAKLGRLDCLVNNVGLHPGVFTIDGLTVEGFRKLLDIKAAHSQTTSTNKTNYALPHLRNVKGNIVNISSVSGTNGQVNSSTYCASKGANLSLTKARAIDESRNGVRVNAICPGPVNTPLLRGWMDNLGEKKQNVPNWAQLGRVGEPREIGLACLFLSTDATFCTGIGLMCTGGCEIGYGVKSDF